MKKLKLISLLTLFLLGSPLLFAKVNQPKLVVQIVVDQLRGDLIHQYQQAFGPKGFNYLLANGLDYHNTHHTHANTVTCAGHAAVATGSYPALNGIIANDWYDRKTGKTVYCVEDLQSPILPTSRSKKTLEGRSPRNLMVSTLSDEVVLAKKGRAFAVSLKDRSAITLAGHAGKAFWFDKENGGFVTSKHYYSSYPQWVNAWNSQYTAKKEVWTLSRDMANYRNAQSPRFSNRFPGFGLSFPHHTGAPGSSYYYKYLSMTPFADELTADFAISLLAHENLGKTPEKTDYLAVSFSAVDSIGHQFGPNSMESEDNLYRLDNTLAKFFQAIDKHIGLDNTLIILTADHGVSDASNYLAAHQLEGTRSITMAELHQTIVKDLANRFQLPEKTLVAVSLPFVYLDHQIINEHHLSINEVSRHLATNLRQLPGIYQAYPLPLTATETDWLSAKVDKMAHPERAGDLYLIPPPYFILAEQQEVRVNHGTPWQYDSYVPLLFANPGFKAQQFSRAVDVTSIAPTLATLMMIKAPSGAIGQPLPEVIKQFDNETH